MAFIPVPNVVQVNVMQRLFDQDVENTLYFLKDTAWTIVEMVDLGSAVISEWTQEIIPLQSQDISFEAVKLRDLTVQLGFSTELPVLPIVQGGLPAPSMPGNVALCIKKVTGYAGPNARGRIYFAGLTEGTVVGNEVSPTFVANLLTSLNDFQGAIESLLPDVHHVHVSRYLNGVPRVQGAYWNVVSFTGNTDIDSQRRRLNGRGS